MSGAVISRLFLCNLAIFFYLFESSKTSGHDFPDDCSTYDISELEKYLSKLNLKNVATIDMMIGGFECPVTALPFGALKSDWARLLLLRRALPKDSVFKEKLGRLFRILVVAYFRMEERFHVVEEDSRATSDFSEFSLSSESTTRTLTEELTRLGGLMSDESTLTTESSTLEFNKINNSTLTTTDSVNDTIPTFASTNTASTTDENIKNEQTTESIVIPEVNITSTGTKGNVERKKSRGDSYVLQDSLNNISSNEDTLRSFFKFESTTAGSKTSSEKDTAERAKARKFFQNFKTINLPLNKVKRPANLGNPPLNNDFWRYIVTSQNVTLPVPTTVTSSLISEPEDINDVNGSLRKSKKRGSSNTSIEKNFRWFYNLGLEDKQISNTPAIRRGYSIACNGRTDG